MIVEKSSRTTVLQVVSCRADALTIMLNDLLKDIPDAEFVTLTVYKDVPDERNT